MQYTSPFISFTAPDAEGVRSQVKVETGILPVKSIEENGKMRKVTFDISALGNAKLKRNPHAAINPSEPAFAEVEAAFKAGKPVQFRIEAQRKASMRISKRVPLGELDAQNETVRCLVAINAQTTSEARTNPGEDRTWSETAPEDAPPFIDVTERVSGGAQVDAEHALGIYRRLAAAQGDQAQSVLAVAAVLAIFGVDVYAEEA